MSETGSGAEKFKPSSSTVRELAVLFWEKLELAVAICLA
jgi:hypothetical protein